MIILHSVVVKKCSFEAPEGSCCVCVVGRVGWMGGGGVCKAIFVLNPTSVVFSLSWSFENTLNDNNNGQKLVWTNVLLTTLPAFSISLNIFKVKVCA